MRRTYDINLIPRKYRKPYSSKTIILIIGIIVIIASLFYLAASVPSMLKNNALAKRTQYDAQIAQLSEKETEFYEKAERRSMLSDKVEYLKTFEETKTDVVGIFDIIETTCPKNVVLSNVSINEEFVMLTGMAGSDSEIAVFALHLRNHDIFTSVFITSSTTTEDKTSEAFTIKMELYRAETESSDSSEAPLGKTAPDGDTAGDTKGGV